MFLLMFVCAAITSLAFKVSASDTPVRSIEITSSNTSYENNEPGAWKITKSAEWTGLGKARITFEVTSIPKYAEPNKMDVVMVIDDSYSMQGDKIEQVIHDAKDLVDYILTDEENRVAFVEFDASAIIASEFTNDKNFMLSLIDTITVKENTNYYDGLRKAGDVLNGYVKQDDRDLIMLFLTDGFPNEETPNEIAQYRILKTLYPYMTINGIQYEMGDEILQPIIDVSDFQFIADMSSLRNVLFDAIKTPYAYDDFVITDYINDSYWTVSGLEAIDSNLGQVSLDYTGSTPKITWDLSEQFHAGQTEELTIDIELQNDYMNPNNTLLPTNRHETVLTSMQETDPENIDSEATPKLQEQYKVHYDANAPDSCEVSGTIPEDVYYSVYSVAERHDSTISCSGYTFKGWRVKTKGVFRINDDYFRMPEKDVEIVAVWGKPVISKSLDGTIKTTKEAVFAEGETFNHKIRALSGEDEDEGYWQEEYEYVANTLITAISRALTLPDWVDTTDEANIVSADDSPMPIYAWYDNGTIYYYSDAEILYLNENSNRFLYQLNALFDIDDLGALNTSRVTSMDCFFCDMRGVDNLDAVSGWDTSNVVSMSGAFSGMSNLTDLSGPGHWNVTKVENMDWMLNYTLSLETMEDLSGWRTPSLKNMGWMFQYAGIRSIDGMEEWDVSHVTKMTELFSEATSLEDISAMSGWNTQSLVDMNFIFSNASSLQDISALANWNVSNVTEMEAAFAYTSVDDISALANWRPVNVEDLFDLFNGLSGLTDISALSEWRTPNLIYTGDMFSGTNVGDISPLNNWDFSHVTRMEGMFYEDESLTDISDIANWNISQPTTINGMFYHTSIDDISVLSSWDISKVTSLNGFLCSTNVSDISPIGGWDISKVTNIGALFCGAPISSLEPISSWNTSKVTNMQSLFSGSPITDFSPISGWNVDAVTNLSFTFSSTKITNLNAFSNWRPHPTSLYWTFYNVPLTDISAISQWDVSKVTNMSFTFWGTKITNLNDLSGWDVSKVTNMSYAFNNVTTLTDISGISGWQTLSLTDISYMFRYDSSITDLSPMENWYHNRITRKTDTFSGVPSTVARPTWY